MKAKSIAHLIDIVHANPLLKQSLLNDPLLFLESVEDRKPPINKTVYYVIICFLILVLLACVFTAGYLVFQNDNVTNQVISPWVISLGSTSFGGITGLLLPISGRN